MKVHKQVADWLNAHEAWCAESSLRMSLVDQWRETSARFGPHSDAATGVLLGLVIAAWGEVRVDIGIFRGGNVRVELMPQREPYTDIPAKSLTAALVLALEKSPV